MIEYTTGSWNPLTGCRHTLEQCPVVNQCWARSMAGRFKTVAGGDFEPRFHPERLTEPFYWRKPRRVAVCFMGDLFGKWVDGWVIRAVIEVVQACPQHAFLFCTKNPARLAEFNPWSSNAWVGASATDVQSWMLACEYLHRVEAKLKWISLEPLIYWSPEFFFNSPLDISWLVLGSYSGRSSAQPRKEWVEEIVAAADKAGIPIWEKSNLAGIMGRPLHQESPQVEGQ